MTTKNKQEFITPNKKLAQYLAQWVRTWENTKKCMVLDIYRSYPDCSTDEKYSVLVESYRPTKDFAYITGMNLMLHESFNKKIPLD